MASNPMLQAVLRFQHQQVTAPQTPVVPGTTFQASAPPPPLTADPQPVEPAMPGAPDQLKEEKVDG